MSNSPMEVVKRDGSRVPFSPDKIQTRIHTQAKGLKVNADEVVVKVIGGFSDGMSTHQLDEYAAETAATMTLNHPDYSTLAARLLVTSLHKETPQSYGQASERLWKGTSLLSEEYFDTVLDSYHQLNDMVDHSRDFNFDYFGLKTLLKSYLLKVEGKVVERPQYLYMRVAVAIWGDNLEMVKKTYDLLSEGYFTHATPTLFNAGLKGGQLASCFLEGLPEDSIEGINKIFSNTSHISASAGGVGMHIHNLRATGSHIHGSGGKSNGILPFLKSMNEWAKYFDQGGGKRKGSFAIYLEPWHKDIHILLDIRKNHGKEENRARELFNALWIPDLFMQRVEENGVWTLFCPNEVLLATGKALQDVYDSPTSKAFTELYTQCEAIPGLGTSIKAQELWTAILTSQMETGTPFLLYKDAANSKSNQQNIGTIKSSNLCCEILEVSNPEEIAVCNLASITLPKFAKKTHPGLNILHQGERVTSKLEVDHQKLYEVTYQVTLNLNRVIDTTSYPVPETKVSNLKHRPIGIGVQGLADLYVKLRLPFDSPEAAQVNREVFETIYYGFLSASCALATQQGSTYETFEGSPLSKGIFQFDMWGVTPSSRWNWEDLKRRIHCFGVVNSLGLAPMPTASTAQILGNTEAFEPTFSNLGTRRVLSGEFVVINKHLVKDLEDLGLWGPAMKAELIKGEGSVQNISSIPSDLKALYKTAFEISQRVIIDQAADRGAFICQSQSMNLFVQNPTLGKLTSMHFHAWKKGLKTGMYYLRTKAAVGAIKGLGADLTTPAYTPEEAIACSLDNPSGCEACGS